MNKTSRALFNKIKDSILSPPKGYKTVISSITVDAEKEGGTIATIEWCYIEQA